MSKYEIAGTYNYKGIDIVVFYKIGKDGVISVKHKSLTMKGTSSHFFKDSKGDLTQAFDKVLNV